MESKNNKIILDESLFIGEGGVSKCYIHPQDKNLCIKVFAQKSFKRRHRNRGREVKYLKSLKRRGKSFSMLYKYFHKVQTNRGVGQVYELIRDYDGDISKSLRYYLDLKDENLCKQIIKLVEDLRKYLIHEYILFLDLHMKNILLKKVSSTEYRLVIIDGVEYNNNIPILEYIQSMGHRRSIKRWEIFRTSLENTFPCLKGNVKKFNE